MYGKTLKGSISSGMKIRIDVKDQINLLNLKCLDHTEVAELGAKLIDIYRKDIYSQRSL